MPSLPPSLERVGEEEEVQKERRRQVQPQHRGPLDLESLRAGNITIHLFANNESSRGGSRESKWFGLFITLTQAQNDRHRQRWLFDNPIVEGWSLKSNE